MSLKTGVVAMAPVMVVVMLTVPAATDKTKAEAVMRAVAAPVLAPIATNEVSKRKF